MLYQNKCNQKQHYHKWKANFILHKQKVTIKINTHYQKIFIYVTLKVIFLYHCLYACHMFKNEITSLHPSSTIQKLGDLVFLTWCASRSLFSRYILSTSSHLCKQLAFPVSSCHTNQTFILGQTIYLTLGNELLLLIHLPSSSIHC